MLHWPELYNFCWLNTHLVKLWLCVAKYLNGHCQNVKQLANVELLSLTPILG